MPRSHIYGLDAGLATDTIGIIRGNLKLFVLHPQSYIVLLNHTYIVHPYRTTEIDISWVIREI